MARKIYTSTLAGLASAHPDDDGIPAEQEVARSRDPFTSIRIVNAGADIRIPWKTPLNSPIQITADIDPTRFQVKNLPAGLTLDQSTGAISGTPEKSGRFKLSLAAKNATGQKVTTDWDLRVEERPTLSYAGTRKFKVNQRVNILPSGVAPRSWPTYEVVSGSLPGGIYLNARTGAIRGHIGSSDTGSYSFAIRAQNSAGSSESSLNIEIIE